MAKLPNYRPKYLSLGPLEKEILQLIWEQGTPTTRDIHERILADPDRELTYSSVTTVLQRLTQKGWLSCDRQERSFRWQALVTQQEAETLQAYDQLQRFLRIGNPDIVAAFADSLDQTSVDQLEAIAIRLHSARSAREEQKPCTD